MKGERLRTILKWIGYLLIAYILFNWFTAGQDEIVEGPPETPETYLLPPTDTP